ncbi:MAG: hypothetical protein WC459_04350 [Patescibacteria group bacterium]
MENPFDKKNEQEKPSEEIENSAPEMAVVETEISPEAMEANEYFEQLRARKLELEIKENLTPEEQEELKLLKEQVEAFDDLGGEIIDIK